MVLDIDNQIVWQPFSLYSKGDFSIIVNRDFVKKASALKINSQISEKMNNLANQLLNEKISQPFLFEDGSYMVSQFTYDAGKGVWLSFSSLGKNALDVFDKNIKYSSHNTDHTYQKIGLMSLVDIWVEYYNTVKNH
ncbi:MAG: hypothetical protein ACP5OG_00055 [Candidatus Nanoarchaeia archaeon]